MPLRRGKKSKLGKGRGMSVTVDGLTEEQVVAISALPVLRTEELIEISRMAKENETCELRIHFTVLEAMLDGAQQPIAIAVLEEPETVMVAVDVPSLAVMRSVDAEAAVERIIELVRRLPYHLLLTGKMTYLIDNGLRASLRALRAEWLRAAADLVADKMKAV